MVVVEVVAVEELIEVDVDQYSESEAIGLGQLIVKMVALFDHVGQTEVKNPKLLYLHPK